MMSGNLHPLISNSTGKGHPSQPPSTQKEWPGYHPLGDSSRGPGGGGTGRMGSWKEKCFFKKMFLLYHLV